LIAATYDFSLAFWLLTCETYKTFGSCMEFGRTPIELKLAV